MQKLFFFLKNNKLGTVTIVLSLTFMFLGLPSQIWQIWKTGSVAGISILAFSLLATQSFFWVLYGFQKKDWFVVVANFVGTIFSTIIVFEYFWFLK